MSCARHSPSTELSPGQSPVEPQSVALCCDVSLVSHGKSQPLTGCIPAFSTDMWLWFALDCVKTRLSSGLPKIHMVCETAHPSVIIVHVVM